MIDVDKGEVGFNEKLTIVISLTLVISFEICI